MFKNLSEFNNAVYDLLYDVAHGNGFDLLYFEQDYQDDTMDVIEYCANNNFLTNLVIWHDGNGKTRASNKGQVRITHDGLVFMEAHSENTIKKLKRDVFSAKSQSWLSLIVAIISLIVSVITGARTP